MRLHLPLQRGHRLRHPVQARAKLPHLPGDSVSGLAAGDNLGGGLLDLRHDALKEQLDVPDPRLRRDRLRGEPAHPVHHELEVRPGAFLAVRVDGARGDLALAPQLLVRADGGFHVALGRHVLPQRRAFDVRTASLGTLEQLVGARRVVRPRGVGADNLHASVVLALHRSKRASFLVRQKLLRTREGFLAVREPALVVRQKKGSRRPADVGGGPTVASRDVRLKGGDRILLPKVEGEHSALPCRPLVDVRGQIAEDGVGFDALLELLHELRG